MQSNDARWREAFNTMFSAIDLQDCTPEAVLQTMQRMQRTANRLEDITIAARKRNIAANDETVLECLRQLYRDGKINHRSCADRHFFSCAM